ncbi:MAG: glycosyltransferase family 2 protein [Bacilli bacterium]|nr:glycosyltransferase family 2 protein [Bacilli bacterium]
MIKYSVLIPAYNRVLETERAIESVLRQKTKDYEIIVLNDASKEDFEPLKMKYKNQVKFLVHKKNKGLSASRNDLVTIAKGKYIVFLDNDDYIDEKFFETIDEYTNDDIDIISFTYDEKCLTDDNNVTVYHKVPFEITSGIDALVSWINSGNSFDSSCSYVYNREFFTKNKFKFSEGRAHEDYALTSVVLSKAKKVVSLDMPLYHVVFTSESITRGINQEKLKRNIYDTLYHFDNLLDYFTNLDIDKKKKKVIYSFLANSVLNNVNKLKGIDNKKYIKELRNRKVHKLLLNDSLKRKTKKMLVSFNYRLFLIVRR